MKNVKLENNNLHLICGFVRHEGTLQDFERVITHLNFTEYDAKDELMKFCEENFMISAFTSLIVAKYEKGDQVACYQILKSIFDIFKKVPAKSLSRYDIKEILVAEETLRRQIETSQTYIGLRLLLIM